jgi:ABC-2 type transport system permease protein
VEDGTGESIAVADAVPKAPDQPEIRAVLVADIDWVAPSIFRLREIGNSDDFEVNWKFQNVTFLLNTLDFLAGEEDFLEIRKRERTHRLLTRIEETTSALRESSLKRESDYIREATEQIEAKQREFEEDFAKKREEWENLSVTDRQTRVRQFEDNARRELNAALVSMRSDRDKQVQQIHRDLELRIDEIQDKYKAWALILPPIPPLLLAFFVFFHRRRGEQEGVARTRLR